MSQLFAEFGAPAGGPPPLLPGADRRDEPYVAQAAEHPVQGARRDPCLLGPLPRSGFPQDLMPVHLPPAEHSEHEGPGGRDRRHTITQYGYSVPRCHGSRRSVCGSAGPHQPGELPGGDLDTLPDVLGEPAGRADGALVLLMLTAYPAGRLRLAQPRRIVRRRPARRPGRVHGRRSGPVERRRAGRRGDRSSMAGQAQLVSGRHRGPDDPATGAAGPFWDYQHKRQAIARPGKTGAGRGCTQFGITRRL